MSILVYKQRHRHPNWKDTPGANYAHIRYIATRPGVVKDTDGKYGLFGKLKPGEVTVFHDWRDIAKLVYKNSQKGIIMYRSVISFAGDTAEELQLTDQKSWQRYIENHIMTIAEKNGIKREAIQWAAAVHGEREHPHIHVVFWDTSVKVRDPFTSPQIPNAIRRQMIKDTFAMKILAFAKQKDTAAKELRQITDEMVDAFDDEMRIRKLNGLRKLWKYLEYELCGETVLERKVLQELADRLFVLRECIPKQGRVAYSFLSVEAKQKTDELVSFLKQVPELKELSHAYVDAKYHMAELYTSDERKLSAMKREYEKEADKILANRILSGVKRIIRMEKEMRSTDYIRKQRDYLASCVLMETLDMLTHATCQQEKELSAGEHLSGELSAEAKKELFLRNQDKGYEY